MALVETQLTHDSTLTHDLITNFFDRTIALTTLNTTKGKLEQPIKSANDKYNCWLGALTMNSILDFYDTPNPV